MSEDIGIDPGSFEEMVQKDLPKDFFSEWARQIDADPMDASIFASVFLELLRNPQNDTGRRAAAALAAFMKSRSWEEIFGLIRGSIDNKTADTFEKAGAGVFYEQLKAMVLAQIRDYWDQFIKSKQEPYTEPDDESDDEPEGPEGFSRK